MAEGQKVIPVPNPDSFEYWAGAKRRELLIQHCRSCGKFQFYPRVFCMSCLSEDIEWSRSSGHGSVYSFSVIHRAPGKAFVRDLPYTVAMVELEEGVRMMTNIVDCPPERVQIGMQVEVVFEDLSEEIALPKFRPRQKAKSRPNGRVGHV